MKRSPLQRKTRINQGDPWVKSLSSRAKLRQAGVKTRKRLKARPDPLLAAWGRRVKKRDGCCKWPGGCQTGDQRLDPHHVCPRGRRPDLRYEDSNSVLLCRTHHQWCHDNPIEATAAGLLSDATYEKARKDAV